MGDLGRYIENEKLKRKKMQSWIFFYKSTSFILKFFKLSFHLAKYCFVMKAEFPLWK